MSIPRSLRVAAALAAFGVSALAGCRPAPVEGQRPSAWLTVVPIIESDAVHPGSTVRAALQAVVADRFHVQSDRPRDPLLKPLMLSFDRVAGLSFDEVVFPVASDITLPGYQEPLSVFEGRFDVGVRLTVAEDHPPGPVVVRARVHYQACDDAVCYQPSVVDTQWTFQVVPAGQLVTTRHADVLDRIAFGLGRPPTVVAAQVATAQLPPAPGPKEVALLEQFDRFEIRGSTGGYLGTDAFLEFIHNAEAGVKARGLFEGRGPLAILALVFVGGLALNLTPCVLPMVPINLAIIGAGANRRGRSRGFLLGAAYGGAMAAVYGGLGLIVILTAGTFGTINASPWFNAAIAGLFVVLGLAMFDIGSIDLTRWSNRVQFDQRSRGTFLLAFGMGAVAALLAGACVAPVVIQVVVFASDLYAGGTSIALALPFFLGLGMALPWPLAGAGLASMPRPGAWMVRVKQVLGVFILGTALYYGYVAYGLFADRWVDPATVRASVEEKLREGWHASLADGLAEAERTGTPLFIDFWATWCKNCLTMDKTTLSDPAVVAALSGYTRVKFQAEDPNASPAREILRRIDAIGLPAYVILRPTTSPATPIGPRR